MRLIVWSDILDRLLLDLEYYDSKTHVNYIKDRLKDDTERWLNHGLIEWIRVGKPTDPDYHSYQRVTQSTDPEFLPRVKNYLSNYSFQSIIGERFMVELEKRFGDRPWFHSVGNDKYGRIVVYVHYMCDETLYDIPDYVDGKQVLCHFAASMLAKREDYTGGTPAPKPQSAPDVDLLTRDVQTLVNDLGRDRVRDIFYEIHDGANALTNLSPKHPYARDVLEKLYDEYGFDVLFDLLDND